MQVVFLPRGLRRFHESPHCIAFSCYRLRPGWRPKDGREPGALPNFVSAADYDLTTFFLPPFRQRRAKGWGTPRGMGMRFRVYFSEGAPAFMRGKERFSAPVKVRLRSAL